MSNFQYEFLSYEAFPDDPYVAEIVTVMINNAVILPFQHVKMKTGGTFWTFPGSQAMKNGEKKRINAEFESRSAKMKFEADLESFIRSKSGLANPTHQPNQNSSTQAEFGANLANLQLGVGDDSAQLPF